MLNLGTLVILIMLYFIKVFVLAVFVRPFRKKNYVENCFLKMTKSMFYDEILILLIEGFMEICLSGAIMIQVS